MSSPEGELDRLASSFIAARCDGTAPQPEEQLRTQLLGGDFASAAAAVRRLAPALAASPWLKFQLTKHQFMWLASAACAGGTGSAEALQQALDLARRELAPLALHSYMEAFADFKHCMLALVSGAAAARPAGGSGGAPHGAPPSELQDFAGVVVRGVRQERRKAAGGGGGGGEPGPAAAPAAACPPLSLLLRYLLLLHQHQHHSGFHPHWWPEVSDASLDLCERLLLPRRDPMPPVAMLDGVEGAGGPAGGVREHDVQALRTSLGCDREEAVALLRRAQGEVLPALQDALEAAQVDEGLLLELAGEYAASRGLEPLPAAPAALPAVPAVGSGEAMQVDQDGERQQRGVAAAASPEAEQQQGSQRPAKVARKEGGSGGGTRSPRASGTTDDALVLPAEMSQQQLHKAVQRLKPAIGGGHAEVAIAELEAADPAFLPGHPGVAFALHHCCFLEAMTMPGGGASAALAIVRQHLTPLAQRHPQLQPQLKAALAQLLPPPGAGSGAFYAQLQLTASKGAVSAIRAALRPRCRLHEPRLVVLLRELLSLHTAHFKLQRCQDWFASGLGITSLKASLSGSGAGAGAGSSAAAAAAAAAAAVAAVAGEALAAAGAAGAAGGRPGGGDVPVPGVRLLVSDTDEDDEMDEDSEGDEDGEGGAGVPESSILTVCEFTGLPRHTAIELLLVHGGDVAAVLAHVFP